MGEDMTYDTTEPTRAQLAARVRELEAQNAELLAAAVTNAQDMLAPRVECDGLRARLDAVPVEAIRRIVFDENRSFSVVRAETTVAGWLVTFGIQAADTDGALKLAQLDEDGDE